MQLTLLDIIIISIINAIVAYVSIYLKTKGKNLATKEDIGKITDEIEKVKNLYNRNLSEYNVRLEKFKKVQEIRIDIFERITKFKLMVLKFADLEKFKPDELPVQYELDEKISGDLSIIVRNLLAHKVFLVDCLDEIDALKKNVDIWWMKKNLGMAAAMVICDRMDDLMKKMMDYENKDSDK